MTHDKNNIYTIINTALGNLLVVANNSGVCHIALGDTRQDLLELIAKKYNQAQFTTTDKQLIAWSEILQKFIAGEIKYLDIPVDISGTEFQKQVWQKLRAIPYGQTRTYSDIAHQINRPKAHRAVARACGSNKLALFIPCHRVIAVNNKLSGFRWGIERKRKLLQQETINK